MEKNNNLPLFADGIDEYLQDERATGIRFKGDNLTKYGISVYVMCGVILPPQTARGGLTTEYRVPEADLFHMLLGMADNSCADIAAEVDRTHDYRGGIAALLGVCPQLKDRNLVVDSDTAARYLFVQGRPFSDVVALHLQYPAADTMFMHSCLSSLTNTGSVQLDSLDMDAPLTEGQKELRLPSNVNFRFGAGKIYFYEKGVIGYAVVTPDRQITWHGAPLSDEAQLHVRRVAHTGNIINRGEHFFTDRCAGHNNLVGLDTDGKLRFLQHRVYESGMTAYLEDYRPLSAEDLQQIKDITGRITQIGIQHRDAGNYIRCRIDGRMQMYERIPDRDYALYSQGLLTDVQVAAKCFRSAVLELTDDRLQYKGVKL